MKTRLNHNRAALDIKIVIKGKTEKYTENEAIVLLMFLFS